MASALEQLNENQSFDTSDPISYSEWRDKQASDYFNAGNGWQQFWRGFVNWPKLLNSHDADFGRDAYNDYVEKFRNKQELKNASISEQNQRAYEERLSNTAYQRAYKDIQATGLNPAMLLNSAFGSASTPSSSLAYTRRSSSSRSDNTSNNRSYSASAVLAALIFLVAHVL